jgi:heme exporter protein D
MDAPSHLGFIVSSYAAAAVVIGGLIAWVALDYRAQRATLAELDRRGVSRRSAPPRGGPAGPGGPAMQQAKEKA